MPEDQINQEVLQALEDSAHLLTNHINTLSDLSNSIGSALAGLDRDDANQKIQEKIEEALASIDVAVNELNGIVEETKEQNEDNE